MRLISLWLVWIVGMAASAAELSLEWHPSVPEVRMEKAGEAVAVELPGSGAAGSLAGTPQKGVRLDDFRYLTLQMRSTDGGSHRIVLWLKRRLNGEENAFATHLAVGPEWREYRLALNRGNELPQDGCFGYWRDRPGREPDLAKGGELAAVKLFSDVPAGIEFQPPVLTAAEAPLSEELRRLKGRVENHPLEAPFRFRETQPEVSIVLARGGQSEWSIAIGEGADETVCFAAAELAKYLQQVTGATFPVVERTAGKAIVLSADLQGRKDGFRSRGAREEIEIVGDSPRGLLYGVYDFLEKAAGVRWFAPFDYGEVVPSRSELTLPGFLDESAPAMEMRRSHYCSWWGREDFRTHGMAMADWAVKNRFNIALERFETDQPDGVEKFYRQRGGYLRMQWVPGHNFHLLIPPAVYGDSHPEYFAFNRATGQWQVEESQLCVSNPEVQRLLAEKAGEYFSANPQEKFFPLFQEDGYALWCQCPACEAIAPTPAGKFSESSDRNIYLANRVCRLIQEKWPDKGVITFAYSFSARPPRREVPAPGVRVLYCYYTDGFPEKEPWSTKCAPELLEWSRLTRGNLAIYTYHYLHTGLQMAEPEALAAAFRFFSQLEVKGSVQESAECWGAPDAYLIYLGGRLAWNPWIDEAALRKDYFAGLYGPAGASMQRYFETLVPAMRFVPGEQTYIGWSFFPAIPDEALAVMDAALSRAEQEAGGDARAARAVAVQREYFVLLQRVTAAARLLEEYYREPDESGLSAIDAALAAMTGAARPLWDKHALSHYGEEQLLGHWGDYLHRIYPELSARPGNAGAEKEMTGIPAPE
ncbi:DUF4838 domain-containing protein [Victivallis sp. Marseille-Q1083]|uniref:DUF4838 domain-containing protein n=1 Tax=Victivallis sp. Marseille-Q1083 TaxID=2717288 RepID=UPI00158A5616|nr:DUF4838 domain-containing protein [Victivallis sp. Marseille-Q1083]